MSKVQRDDESATPDQLRAQEKREAGQARADAAAKASAEQEWPPVIPVTPNPGDDAERTKAPKGRKASPKSEA